MGNQTNTDGQPDGGDACDNNNDNDLYKDGVDNCRDLANDQTNGDGDQFGSACDVCPNHNDPGQGDIDGDAVPGSKPPPAATWGGDACDDDADGDGRTNASDGCPTVFVPSFIDDQRPDPDHDGSSVWCLDPDDLMILSGEPAHVMQDIVRFLSPTEPLHIPIDPCRSVACVSSLPENYTSQVQVSLPFATQMRIVDDAGASVSQSRPALTQMLHFPVRSAFHYEVPGGGAGAGSLTFPRSQQAGLLAGESSTYQGTQYFLEIFPPAGVVLGQDYAITIATDSSVAPSCVPSDPAGDPDADGLTTAQEENLVGTNPCIPDFDDDGCPDGKETGPNQLAGGDRDPLNPWDYFNPTGDGVNRVDDILAVVDQYHDDDSDGNPGLPPYALGYNPDTDRTYVGPNSWNLGPPNGQVRVDDILNSVNQYHHDCS